MVITGIGSRETPTDIMDQMTLIGHWCRSYKVWLRSGHADGADWAFEQGAQEACIAYLPWANFNQHLKSEAHFVTPEMTCAALDITKKFHPAFDKLSHGALALQCRNANQVLGSTLDKPTQAVVCWTSDGKASGGTGQALRIAHNYGIPVLNMYWPMYSNHKLVIDALKNVLKMS